MGATMQLKGLFSPKKPPASRWLFAFLLLTFSNLSNDFAKGISSHSRGELWFSGIMIALYVPILIIFGIRMLWERELTLLWMVPITALYIADLLACVRGDSDKALLWALVTMVAQLPLKLMKPKLIAREPDTSSEPEKDASPSR
jgi:hypothetical protein